MKNFFRKVAFGIGPNENVPSDPLQWAKEQLNDVPQFSWKGKKIYTEKELRKFYGEYIYGDRKILRKKYKDDKHAYKIEKDKLRHKTGQKYWQNLELCIRHTEALKSKTPVHAKLWYFWGNHFAISDKDFLARYSTGAYQRETIRANMNQNFEKMVYEGTVAWAMIHHLDNQENIGPKSESAKEEWRRREKEPATINENHARELLELHTVSPNSGYTQEDIVQLAYIMTGWRPIRDKKKLETANIFFSRKHHQPGKKVVMGKKYKSGKKSLSVVIRDLVNHPSCRNFIATKLCRYLITDYPTKDMIVPIVKAWEKSDGFLPEIHKAAVEVAFNYSDKYQKFQNPENWLLQMSKMCDINLIPGTKLMESYELGYKPSGYQRSLERLLKELGHHPYLAKQPNGWSDYSEDWMSPELMIRRLIFAKQGYFKMKPSNQNNDFYEKMIRKNFDNPNEILKFLKKKNQPEDRHILLFNLPEALKA